jgi:hypothetical protein
MTECSQLGFELPSFNGRKIEGNFEGGNVSSDGGFSVTGSSWSLDRINQIAGQVIAR